MELGQLGDHRYVTVVLSLGNRLTHWFSAFFSLSVTSLSYLSTCFWHNFLAFVLHLITPFRLSAGVIETDVFLVTVLCLPFISQNIRAFFLMDVSDVISDLASVLP